MRFVCIRIGHQLVDRHLEGWDQRIQHSPRMLQNVLMTAFRSPFEDALSKHHEHRVLEVLHHRLAEGTAGLDVFRQLPNDLQPQVGERRERRKDGDVVDNCARQQDRGADSRTHVWAPGGLCLHLKQNFLENDFQFEARIRMRCRNQTC